mmetsp:Transcript_37802/g.121563  ORF Transcript_37802/g.121563 Transcript_37802/m.121563 type:complete len:207 (+) Transcript_37802:346-966(+)
MPTSLRHPGVVLLLQVLGLHGVGSHARRNPAGCGWTPRGPPPWCAESSCGGRRWRGRSATSRRPAPSLLGCSISTLVVASSRVVGSTGLARRLASPSTVRRVSSSMLRLAAWRRRASTLSASTSPTSPHLCRSCAFNAPRKVRLNSSLGLKALLLLRLVHEPRARTLFITLSRMAHKLLLILLLGPLRHSARHLSFKYLFSNFALT